MIGAWLVAPKGVQFRVWAPQAEQVEVLWENQPFPMERKERGYYEALLTHAFKDGHYKFRLNQSEELPDPASRFQPEGPHGPSQVMDREFPWTDQDWQGVPLKEMVIYELHVGTFSEEGTFKGVEKHLQHLKDLGVNTLELMPLAQFAGHHNWGYDGVDLFAVQNSYADEGPSPTALKRLINTCHEMDLAVILDVVYNHLGPEGNYLKKFGPYFQSKYKTSWGEAINFDGAGSDEVRAFFLENVRLWLEEFHFDGLRLDATHAIFDNSAFPFLEELSLFKKNLEEKLGRTLWLIAESDKNDARLLESSSENGMGMDGQWADDLHHCVHVLLTGEKSGYYQDYGTLSQLARIFEQGVLFQGELSKSRRHRVGRSYRKVDHHRLVVCCQNHDQIGNRKEGERLMGLVGAEKQKLASSCVFLSSFLPLLFMGEENGEKAPFLYFVDHTDPDLLQAVRRGRTEEFSGFSWQGEVPDPGSRKTFLKSKLHWQKNQEFFEHYKQLISLSKWIRKEGLLERGLIKTKIHRHKILEVKSVKEGIFFRIYFSFSDQKERLVVSDFSSPVSLLFRSSHECRWEDHHLHLSPYSAAVLGGPFYE